MAVLGLRFCARVFSSCGKWGPLFIAVRWPLTIAASPVAEHRLQTCRLSSCGPRAQLLRGTWDPPRPGLEPVSPASAGRFSTTAPPGKPPLLHFWFSWPLLLVFYSIVIYICFWMYVYLWNRFFCILILCKLYCVTDLILISIFTWQNIQQWCSMYLWFIPFDRCMKFCSIYLGTFYFSILVILSIKAASNSLL